MATLTTPPPATNSILDGLVTVADLVAHLGGIPPHRIRLRPLPGTADEHDVAHAKGCELVDGIVVEKAMGYFESRLAIVLAFFVESYLESEDRGFALGEDAPERIGSGRVRRPDFSFYLWDRFPDRQLPREQILRLAPDWAVEVISLGNTRGEMDRKRQEYFDAGTRLVWLVYPDTVEVHVYSDASTPNVVGQGGTLDGGTVLPGFRLSVRRWFERAGRRAELDPTPPTDPTP